MSDSPFDQFSLKLREIRKERETINNELYEIFREKLEKLNPVIDFMKQNGLNFSHPDLPGVYTSLGAIIGKNHRTQREFYVYDGNSMIICEVSTSNPDTVMDQSVSISRFVQQCNLDFAYNGIKYTENSISRIIDGMQNKIDSAKEFINKVKEE